MTTAIAMRHAALSLMSALEAADMGTVPAHVVSGCMMKFGVEGAEQEYLQALVMMDSVRSEAESITGYWRSGTENVTAPNLGHHRGPLEEGNLFKEWSRLQKTFGEEKVLE